MKQQLQILVKNSKIEISPEILKKKADAPEEELSGIFNPCINHRSRVLLYVKFKYRGIEKIVIYDHKTTPKLVLPNDII